MTRPSVTMRKEFDSLGDCSLARDCLFGINTWRAMKNFPVSHRPLGAEPAFVHALATVKIAAARANRSLGALDGTRADAIAAACREVMAGRHLEHFTVDLLEGSGGTSINMNVNEVIANRALQILGREPGDYGHVHPNDHVNLGQSTNDVVPTALKLAVHRRTRPLLDTLGVLAAALGAKAGRFADVLRVGRTCMQAALPMTLGQAFSGYATAVARTRVQLRERTEDLLEVPLGGTAIGTGLGSRPGYRAAVIQELATVSGENVRAPANQFDAMQNADALARHSGELRIAADVIGKIASDLVLLGSGSNSGLGEITLPAVQSGSSIMPGKVNPVLPMLMQQVAFAVTGNDLAVSMAALQGQLEINHFEPVMASRMFDSITLIDNSARIFAEHCVAGITANHDRCLKNLLESSAIATVFLPRLGYARTTEIVRRADRENRPFIHVAIEAGLLDPAQVLETLQASSRGPMPEDTVTESRVPCPSPTYPQA